MCKVNLRNYALRSIILLRGITQLDFSDKFEEVVNLVATLFRLPSVADCQNQLRNQRHNYSSSNLDESLQYCDKKT